MHLYPMRRHRSARDIFFILTFLLAEQAFAADSLSRSGVWQPDRGDGTYKNPIIYADYSDPDVIRVGDDYYMTASSMSHFPGLPILHSKDLVNWTIIGHAVQEYPFPEFKTPQHGMAVWAPSIRFHNGEFMIYFGDPDRGIFMTKTKNPAGPWEPLRLIRKATGWIDPCPLWDDDGNAYMVHAFANSRAGIKSILAVNKMTPDGLTILDDGFIVFVGHRTHPTIEGPKFYKRNGYYYIFAPAGGVKPGWQSVLRSKDPFGPYEYKNVLAQGKTIINGPHQGGWVDTPNGENWFIHFQDRYAYGRLVHLQPMRWENDWPVMGINQDSSGCGEPVLSWKKPNVGKSYPIQVPQTSDEFDVPLLGLQWQWQANCQKEWYSLTDRPGWLRMFARSSERSTNLSAEPALLLQKIPAPYFSMTTKLDASGLQSGERSGLIVFGLDYAVLAIERNSRGFSLVHSVCMKADKGSREEIVSTKDVNGSEILLRLNMKQQSDTAVVPEVLCTFSFSRDGISFSPIGKTFVVRAGFWVGAKAGLFVSAPEGTRKNGFADFDYMVIDSFKE